MKKFTLILISVFMMGSLMAQTGLGPLKSYNYMGSQANALYSQMNPQPQTYSVVSQQFTDKNNKVAQDADDFVVPAGKTWNISSVTVLGNYFNGGTGNPPNFGPADSFIIQIFEDNNGLPGATPVFEESALQYSELNGVFTIAPTNPIQLMSGTYWISVVAIMSYNEKGEWGWAWNKDPQAGMEFVNQDPNGALDGNPWPASWAPASTTWPGQVQYDLCFQLDGSEVTTSVPVSNWAIVLGVFLIGAFMVVRYRRTLA